MAHTDVHRPLPVIKADPLERHRFYRFQKWAALPPVLWPIKNLCGCRMCTGHHWRRADRRRDRHRAKQQLRRNHADE